MWWSRAILCLMVLALGPAGCGFQPIYARPGSVASSPMADQLASVRVSAIDERTGQQLRTSLVQTLSPRGEPARPRYLLKVQLIQSLQGLANSQDGSTTVGRVNMDADFVLQDLATNATVYSGRARSFSGYRFLGPRYASTVSEREAETSAITEVAAEIRSSLAAYFSDPATFQQRLRESAPRPLPTLGPAGGEMP